MEDNTDSNTIQEFKTPIYQRNAYKAYIARKKTDPVFMERRKAQQKIYYEKNRVKIIATIKARIDRKKAEKATKSPPAIVYFD